MTADRKKIDEKHAQTLSGLKSPVTPSDHPDEDGSSTVDIDKLKRAWNASVEVQKDLVTATMQNIEDNEATRRSNVVTRRVTILGACVVVVAAVFGKIEVNVMRQELSHTREQVVVLREQNTQLRDELQHTMKAMRASIAAFNSFLENQAVDSEVVQAALDASEVTLEVSAEVEDDPAEYKVIKDQLERVRSRKAAMPSSE